MVGIVLIVITILYLLIKLFETRARHPLGIICLLLNTFDFGTPLLGLVRLLVYIYINFDYFL